MFNMNTWSNDFFSKANEQMDENTSKIFVNLVMAEQQKDFDIPGVEQEFIYQIIDKRAEYIGLRLSKPLKIFLSFLAGNPGSAVMYLYALRNKMNSVNMLNFTNLFPEGFLSQTSLSEMWDKQKGYVCGENIDNCLDGYQFD